MNNACKEIYEKAKCKGCPFKTFPGCSLYGHPINWDDKIKEMKGR